LISFETMPHWKLSHKHSTARDASDETRHQSGVQVDPRRRKRIYETASGDRLRFDSAAGPERQKFACIDLLPGQLLRQQRRRFAYRLIRQPKRSPVAGDR